MQVQIIMKQVHEAAVVMSNLPYRIHTIEEYQLNI